MNISSQHFFLKLISCYKKQIFLLFLLGVLSSLFFLAAPYFSKLFIDNAFINKDLAKFLNFSLWGAGIFITSALFSAVTDIIKSRISIKVRLNLANSFIRKFYSLDMAFFQSKSVGENIYRFSNLEAVSGFILEQCPLLLIDMFKLPVILVICLWLSPQMTVFLIILSPLFLLHSVYMQKKLKPIYEEIWKHTADLSRKLYEAFSKIMIIKLLGLEDYQRHNYLKALIRNIRWGIKSFRWAIVSSLSASFLSKAVYGAVTLYGGWLIIKGRLTLGVYTAVMLYLTQVGGLLQSFGARFEHLVREAVAFDKIFEVLGQEPKIKDASGAVSLESAKCQICFNNVSFGYEKGKQVLKNINISIPASCWVGIAGPSGCGKTTLVNLMLRLYDPQCGNISLNGIDLKDIKLASLRKRATLVTQQPFLFDESIKYNIACGLKDVSDEEIMAAARLACLDDFILTLPRKYDTLIGEDGCSLSGGLKQRLSIARAVLRKPDLLILDEATSSVDSFTEEKIFKTLRNARRGNSTIIISHRLFSIKDADRIYFLNNDSKIEEVTHEDLLSTSKTYKDFFHSQLDEERIPY